MVTSFPVWHAPKRPKSSFRHFQLEEKRLYIETKKETVNVNETRTENHRHSID
jgi:hypothetical protein